MVNRVKHKDFVQGIARLVEADVVAAADSQTTILSVDWSIMEGESITIGEPVFSDPFSTALVTASSTVTGNNLIKITANLADGQSYPLYLCINVVSPKCPKE